MRFTAIFSGTQGPGGVPCPETGRLYMMFDVTGKAPQARDKAVANAVGHIRDGLAGEPQIEAVLVGAFLPRSLYADPFKQQQREDRAGRVTLYEYRLPT